MRVSNWGMLLLAVYLIITGLGSFGLFLGLGRIEGLIALVAGVLMLLEHTRGR